ncbi:hypothetical protein [Saccharopolyspora griseoalba]|uniref:WXG100 family type VII secretion target n=1 Tax=Saccharopolyspora griseoalba TaxID=1431848 RepID=A0ABW2LJ93_9PSEU
MSGFRSDLASLSGRADEFAEHAERARRAAADLRRAVESAGQCWGRDEIGQRFAAAHRAPAEETLAAVEEIPGRLREMGDKLAATADTARSADLANADEIGRLAGEV